MSTKHITTHEGQSLTRTSENRVYSHATWMRDPAALLEKRVRKHYTYEADRAAHYTNLAQAGGGMDKHPFQHTVRSQYITADQARAMAEEYITRAADARAKLDAGFVDGQWFVEGWASRLELAEKRASTMHSKGFEVVVKPVTIVTPKLAPHVVHDIPEVVDVMHSNADQDVEQAEEAMERIRQDNEGPKAAIGSASVLIQLVDGRIIVNHGTDDWVLESWNAREGHWDRLWATIRELKADALY